MKAIITFHSIDMRSSVLSFRPDAFACLLQSLDRSGLPILPLPDLLLDSTPKGVTLTFDDGMRSVLTAALPVIREHRAPAHLFLTTSSVGGNNRWPGQPETAPGFDMLSWPELEELQANGVHVESHTHSHPDLRGLDQDELQQECATADELIESHLGRRPRYFAYPYGYHDAEAVKFISRRYEAAVTTRLGTLSQRAQLALLPRLDSYYLRAHWLHQRLDSPLCRSYLGFRRLLRTLRGTH